MSSYCQSRTKTCNSLEEKRTQDGPKPEVPVCPLSASCQLTDHALFAVNPSIGEQNGDCFACLVGFTKEEHL
jgi:hypothetical protein